MAYERVIRMQGKDDAEASSHIAAAIDTDVFPPAESDAPSLTSSQEDSLLESVQALQVHRKSSARSVMPEIEMPA